MNKPAINRLDISQAPLAGINLIEASAGTGKTHTITGLYLRLVLDAECPVRNILVVTYTKAATEELRDRIRQRLLSARAAFERETAEEDDFLQLLLAHSDDYGRSIRRLTNAIRGFDEAAIYTIHGFCQRVLGDSAFESAMPFETELLPDERALLQEIVDDFWRREFYHATPLTVNFLLDEGYTPESLLQEIRSHLGKAYLTLKPPQEPPGFAAAEAVFAAAYAELRGLWQEARDAVERLLLDAKSLNGNRYRKTSIPGWLGLMDDYLMPEMANLKVFSRFEKFSASHLAAATKSGQLAPQHPVFDVCDRLLAAYRQLVEHYRWYLRAVRLRLIDFCNRELAQRKRRLQLQSYNDLLENLDRALQGERGESLAASIRQRYSAALIDEFQDTDPIQYDIFRRIYLNSDRPVFLVGDPKQAIYSFRGADIFAYLKARNDAAQRYTLDVNWRSDPDLLRAFNALFEHSSKPFLFADIPYIQARAAKRERQPLLLEGMREPPFQFWFLGRDEDDRLMAKAKANEQIAAAVAAEIARLLNLAAAGEACIGERVLDGGDIAVLVRSHRQGRLVRDALLRLGVPSVQQAQDNVFASWEAQELERLLLAVAEPGRETLVRAALATDLLGLSGEQIYHLNENEQAWEERLHAFHEYHRLWAETGFIRMFRTLLSEESVPRRLLRFRDGERRLTNLLHLAELLQATASRQRSGMEGLIKWLAEHRRSRAVEDEEYQLRLESDEHLVKIVTMHKSKGLEYPIVFCPFLWDGHLRAEKGEIISFHDPENDYRPTLDFGSERRDDFREYARREELAENLRLFYVAVTRAQHQLYLVWGAIKDCGLSAPAWLLHPPPLLHDDLDNVAEFVESLSDERLLNDLAVIAEQADGAIRIESPPEDTSPYNARLDEETDYEARFFPGPIKGKWRINSFTALASGHGAESPDYDAAFAQVAQPPAGDVRTMFAFPRGARAGTCLHSILELFDFTQSERGELEELTASALEQHGFEGDWTPVVADCLQRVVATALPDGIRLQDIPARQRLNELAFYYPLADLNPDTLRHILLDHLPENTLIREQVENLAFAPARGFMKGFIDLVFEAGGRYYLIDYKSNWLGMEFADYRPAALTEAMARESYYFQYLIYLVALHRYLRLRLQDYDYDRHIGGVGYLFLRGMHPDLPGNGVYWDKPAAVMIDKLDAYLAAGVEDDDASI